MSLDLDTRQRAILQEIGVRVWWPETVAEAPAPMDVEAGAARTAPQALPASTAIEIENRALGALASEASAAPKPSRPAPLPKGAGAPVAPTAAGTLAEGIAAMDWPTLADTVAACQACALCTGRRQPVFGAAEAPAQADWLVVGEPPDESEERQGAAFAEQAGQLLDNMLKAVGVSRRGAQRGGAGAAYVTNVVKCRPAVVRNPSAQELALCDNYLRREVALVRPKVILAMGRFAAQALLRDSLPDVAGIPLGKLRGQIHHYQGIPVVVTYHPTYLLRTQPDKARAWVDLCLALDVLRRADGQPAPVPDGGSA